MALLKFFIDILHDLVACFCFSYSSLTDFVCSNLTICYVTTIFHRIFWAYGSVQLQLTKWLMLFANSVWIDDYQPIVVVVSVLNSILALCFVGLAVIATWLPAGASTPWGE